jgi:hypothetical protein
MAWSKDRKKAGLWPPLTPQREWTRAKIELKETSPRPSPKERETRRLKRKGLWMIEAKRALDD